MTHKDRETMQKAIHEGFKISKESVDKLFPKKDIDILGYESPIELIVGQMRMVQEDNILKAVQEQGVSVDKDELVKALQYDRNQYEKGYINGYNAKASEVATEIFEEIDSMIDLICAMTGLDIRVFGKYAELKKKYTESEDTECLK